MNKVKPSLFTQSFNSRISRLSSQNAHREVVLTYYSMFTTNTPPDSYTFPALLKSCISLNLFSLGLSLHQHIFVNGFSLDPFVSSSLINFYSKFGDPDNAHKVFDSMPERNIVPWTAIIGCHSRSGDAKKSFSMFNEMRVNGVEPSVVTFLGLVCGVSELKLVKILHCCVVVYGFEVDIALANSLINVYGKCASVNDASDLFELTDRDLVSWNSLISGYALIGDVEQILQLLHRMTIEGVLPDHQTFGSLLSANAITGDPDLGKWVHGRILRSGFTLDSHVVTSLLVMYLKCRKADIAFRIFEQIVDKDVVLWNAMISGLVQNDCAEAAILVFHEMIKSGVKPSTATIASAISACARLTSLNLGTSIHGYVMRQRILTDTHVENSLVSMYAKCGRSEESYAVFDRMGVKDLVSWNAIITGYAKNSDLSKALFFFTEMRKMLQRPDSVTVLSLLQSCASMGALQQGKLIHNFVIRSCLRPCLLVDTALVDMYCKCGDLRTAQKCFNGMLQRDLISWSIIISGYGSHGKGNIALKMYSEFLQKGFKPNDVIFLAVLSACSHNGLVNPGLCIFQSMTMDFGIEPKLEHLACVIDLLCRAGRVEDAYNFYKRNFSEPMVDVLGILLDACRASGNTKLGNIIAEDVVSLRPENAGSYVQVVRCYAALDRWNDMGDAWTMMRSLGLRKSPGWSFIELHGVITTFFMDHSSHPQSEEIMLLSKRLNMKMRKKNEEFNLSD